MIVKQFPLFLHILETLFFFNFWNLLTFLHEFQVYIHFSQHWGYLMPNNMPRPYFCRLLKWFFSFLCILFQSGESKHTIHDQAEILKSNHVHAKQNFVVGLNRT